MDKARRCRCSEQTSRRERGDDGRVASNRLQARTTTLAAAEVGCVMRCDVPFLLYYYYLPHRPGIRYRTQTARLEREFHLLPRTVALRTMVLRCFTFLLALQTGPRPPWCEDRKGGRDKQGQIIRNKLPFLSQVQPGFNGS